VVGYFVGRSRSGHAPDDRAVKAERDATLKLLVELVESAEQMSSDVECHHSEMQETADHVGNMQVTGEMESVKQALMGHISGLMASNQQLQEDLACSRYRMEEQAQQVDEARREARTDQLTSVPNRKAFDEKLHVLHRGWERDGDPYVLILLDLDQFKWINDCHGHQAGDRVLETVGAGLKEWVREEDFVGRYGGDEFAILMPHTEMDAGAERAEDIRLLTADATSRIAMRGEQISVSVSIGVAAPRGSDTLDAVFARADQALYRSKQLGRNQVTIQEPEQPDGAAQEPEPPDEAAQEPEQPDAAAPPLDTTSSPASVVPVD
jgi:diguanylate cyclase